MVSDSFLTTGFIADSSLATGFIIVLIVYVYIALTLMTIAKKTRTPDAWMAWVPIVNFYLMSKIAKMPWWTFLVAVIALFVPFVGPIVFGVIFIMWWWKIAEARKKPGWLALLLLLPIVNLVIMGIIAWAD